jgi:hypothetical protein
VDPLRVLRRCGFHKSADEIEARIRNLEEEHRHTLRLFARTQRVLVATEARLGAARKALEKFDPQCWPGCASSHDPNIPEYVPGPCDCGLAELQAALQETKGDNHG